MDDFKVSDLAKLWRTLTKLVKRRTTRVTVRELIEFDCSMLPPGSGHFFFARFDLFEFHCFTQPPVSGQTIGPLFHFWLRTCGSWKSRNMLTRAGLTADEMKRMMIQEGPKWFFHTITTLCSRGTTCNLQVFFMSMILQFRGLSRNGSDLIAATGMTLTRSTYGRFLEGFIAREEETLR